ncbi:hypothetical protein EV201_2650 [Ancylomarina subtilis]|uniref:Uncharacterized protein n=1 Tax=Ancylomarina subtilis TaxID=1639035 RepID=A0A4Q7VDJ4_9BACT|nr:hypothetical protein [Ancylomarina subtilis]RZT93483.1 hypothetical protein EV201_2650 [Ancylomarina subtilis]
MKHYALLISILSITFSCANQKNTHKNGIADSAQVTKEIPINISDFAPNTLALNIKILKIIYHNKYNEIHATVNKTLGSGAGIIGIYSKGKEIRFETESDSKVEINSNYSFLFKESQSMGNNETILNLIKEVK